MHECLVQVVDILTDMVDSVEDVEDAIVSAGHGTYWFTGRFMGSKESWESGAYY
jgi:hypothetical protein